MSSALNNQICVSGSFTYSEHFGGSLRERERETKNKEWVVSTRIRHISLENGNLRVECGSRITDGMLQIQKRNNDNNAESSHLRFQKGFWY